MKKIDQSWVLLVGLILVVLLSLKHVTTLAATVVSSVRTGETAPTFTTTWKPYPVFETIENGVTCNARSRMNALRNAPLMPPKDDTWFGCWGDGSVESARGPRGSTECVGVYNGKKSPPRKFKHAKGEWYGCNFNTEGEGVWECPSCTIKPDSTSFP